MALGLSNSVREINTHDGALLLDIEGRKCVGLTPVALKIWRLSKRQVPLAAIAQSLSAEFHIPLQQAQNDAAEFLDGLSNTGLLQDTPIRRIRRFYMALIRVVRRVFLWLQNFNHQRPPKKRVPILLALIALSACDLLGLSRDFTAMYEFVRGWEKAGRKSDPDTVIRIRRAMAYACVWYPKRVLCLQRSAVLTCLLRWSGVPAEMVMGAQIVPFKAHAWTEIHNSPIDESKDVRKTFLIWERC